MKLILLHGLGQTSSSWYETKKVLNTSDEILCPNLYEWLYDKPVGYNTLYSELEKYCDKFDEPLNLCGLSLGGILAMQYCINHPDKVNSLILIGTQYIMPKNLLKMQNLVFRIMPYSTFEKMGFKKSDFIELCNSMVDLNFECDLNKIKCPTLVVCGDKDKANKKAAIGLRERIKNAELVIIEKSGHEINIENPTQLGVQLNRFLKNI
ncbi:alpha/beta fold hydrolase [Peptacetobacter hiranonis]|uniref:alpha/beta fold hydrolase n=1 Tax=Peptacetobacter hiranonis TaxID=89152 RepID=UPI003D8187C9